MIQDLLSKYWGMLSFIAVVIFYGLWAYFKVGDHEKRIGKLEDNKDAMTGTINTLNERLSGMDGKLDILVEGYKKK